MQGVILPGATRSGVAVAPSEEMSVVLEELATIRKACPRYVSGAIRCGRRHRQVPAHDAWLLPQLPCGALPWHSDVT